jgi:hypothetical protein
MDRKSTADRSACKLSQCSQGSIYRVIWYFQSEPKNKFDRLPFLTQSSLGSSKTYLFWQAANLGRLGKLARGDCLP